MATCPKAARLPLGIAIACACAGAIQAETQPRQLKDVVVSATLSEHETRTAPASVAVVTRAEIEARQPLDLLDAVRGAPGVTLMGRGVGGRKTMGLRGLEGKHTLTLIDGRRIAASDDVVGHSDFQYGWLPMSAIERVEVLRGPMSTLYGSEALGGVVNIVTRQPKDRWIGSLALSAGELLKGDGGDRAGASVFAAGPLGPVNLRLSGETQRVAAVPRKEDTRFSELEGRDHDTASLAADWAFAPGQRLAAGWYDGKEERWRDNVTRVFAPPPARDVPHVDRSFLTRSHGYLAWNGDFGPWRAQLGAYRSELDVRNERSNNLPPTTPQNLREAVVDGLVGFRLGGHKLTVGAERRVETLIHPALAGGQDDATHQALFLQDEVALGKTLMLTAGLRRDHHEFFGTEWSPRLYLVWEASPALVVKGGYGHAFKAPTLKQISPVYAFHGGPHSFYGNPNLRPETSDSFEIGADWRQGALNLRGVLFHTRIEDMIAWKLLRITQPGNRRHFEGENIDRATVGGLELGADWTLARGLSLQTDLTLLDTKNQRDGKELYNRPKSSLAARLDWDAGGGWQARLGLERTGTQLVAVSTTVDGRLPAYTLWNASVARQIGKQLNLRVGVNNIGNTRLAEKSPNFGYAERGRTLFASLRADF